MRSLIRTVVNSFEESFCVSELGALFRGRTLLGKALFIFLTLPLLLPLGYAVSVLTWRVTSQPIFAQFFSSIFFKTLLFQVLVEVAFILYIALMLREEKYNPFFTLTHILFIGFGIVLVASALFSLDANAGFFGSARRGDGVFFLLHVGLYIFLLSWTLKSWRAVEALLGVAILGGLTTAVFIFVASFAAGLNGFSIQQEKWREILQGSLGNMNFVGHYFLMLFLFGVYFVLQKPTRWRLFVPVAFLLIIVLTSSNTPLILAGGVLLILLAWATRWLFYSVLLAGSSIALYLAFTGDALFVHLQSLRDSVHIRILIWKDAINAIASGRPWFGHGWGNNEFVWNFARSDTPAQFYNPSSHFLADRMHNLLLEITSAVGIIGLLVAMIILANIFWRLLRTLRVKYEASALFFFGAFTAQFIYLMFNFDTLMSYILVGFLLAGFIVFYEIRRHTVTVKSSVQRAILAVIGGLGIAVLLFYANILPFRVFFHKMEADVHIAEVPSYVNPSSKVGGIIDELNFALSIKQPYRSLWRDIGTSFYDLSDAVSLTTEERLRVYHTMSTLYQELLAHSPMSVNAYHNLALIEFKFNQDPKKAQEYLKKAIQLAPHNGLIRFQSGLLYFNNSDSESAKEVFKQGLNDGVYVGPANLYLGFIDFQAGHIKDGKKKVITALSSYQPRDHEFEHLATSFLTHASKDELLMWYQKVSGLLKSPSRYVDKKTFQLAKELDRDDLADFYAKKLQRGVIK